MTNRKHHFCANLEESNEKAASQLILNNFFLISLKLHQFKESFRDFARISGYSCSKMSIGNSPQNLNGALRMRPYFLYNFIIF